MQGKDGLLSAGGIGEGSSDRWPLKMHLEKRVRYGQSEMGIQQRPQRQDIRQKQEEGPFEKGDRHLV